jgi:hypothetical protein
VLAVNEPGLHVNMAVNVFALKLSYYVAASIRRAGLLRRPLSPIYINEASIDEEIVAKLLKFGWIQTFKANRTEESGWSVEISLARFIVGWFVRPVHYP